MTVKSDVEIGREFCGDMQALEGYAKVGALVRERDELLLANSLWAGRLDAVERERDAALAARDAWADDYHSECGEHTEMKALEASQREYGIRNAHGDYLMAKTRGEIG